MKKLTALLIISALLLSGCAMKANYTNDADESMSVADSDDVAAYDMETSNVNGSMPMPESSVEFSEITESGFVAVAENPLSTFAADVDTASYSVMRSYLSGGNEVPAESVRVEEMINYFSYDYPVPSDDSPFSVTTEVFPCPWNSESKLVRIGLGTAEPIMEDLPSSNLVFLIDVSGSMNADNKLPLVKQAFALLTENLKKGDRVSIVTYASNDAVVLDGATGDEQMDIQNAIENLSAGGGTHGSQGIITAYELAEKYYIKGGNNRVILATDGDLNVGLTTEKELKELIVDKKKNGVFLSVMGFGSDNLKDNKLETLADNGNGNYSYIDSVTEARRVLVEQMGGTLFTVAKDVKLQAEFTDAVTEYRLIGYENRMMAAEDFEDDSKDGGEIGAGHRVTVLYEVKGAKDSGKLLTLSIRYKEPEGDESVLKTYDVNGEDFTETPSEDSVFGAAVAQYGMLLRNSEYTQNTDCTDIYNRIKDLECVKNDPYKQEFLGFVKSIG